MPQPLMTYECIGIMFWDFCHTNQFAIVEQVPSICLYDKPMQRYTYRHIVIDVCEESGFTAMQRFEDSEGNISYGITAYSDTLFQVLGEVLVRVSIAEMGS